LGLDFSIALMIAAASALLSSIAVDRLIGDRVAS
jgi:hypothetical protein